MRNQAKGLRSSEQRIAYLMLLPYLVGLLGLVLIPSVLSIGLGFTRFDALTPPTWVGLENLARLFSDRLFYTALQNTLIYLCLAVALRVIGALGLALLMHHKGRFAWGMHGAVYLPTAIPDVAYALIWLLAFNPTFGPVNLFLGFMGLPTPAWVLEPWPAMFALVIMATWQLGEGFIVLLASLREIPDELLEASALDGTNGWQRFRHVTLPLLMPRLLLLTARDLIINLQANFVPSLLVTKGGPGYATLLLPLYTYQLAFDDLRFGYAATVVWAMYAITVLIILFASMASRRWRYEGSF